MSFFRNLIEEDFGQKISGDELFDFFERIGRPLPALSENERHNFYVRYRAIPTIDGNLCIDAYTFLINPRRRYPTVTEIRYSSVGGGSKVGHIRVVLPNPTRNGLSLVNETDEGGLSLVVEGALSLAE